MKGFKPTGYGPSAGFKFPASYGFTGSTGAYTNVQPHVRHKPRAFKDGGYVSEKAGDPGHALVQRDRPYTNEDQQSGGRSPLRRGFKSGGKMRKARGGPVRGALSSMVGKAKQQQMMKAPAPKPMPATGMKGKFAAADGGRVVYGSSSKGFLSDLGKTLASPAQIPRIVSDAMKNKLKSTQEEVATDKRRRIDRIADGMASNYSRGGKAKRMGYAKGGGVSAGQAKKIAERTVGEHVKYPAPKGHKGLGAMCK